MDKDKDVYVTTGARLKIRIGFKIDTLCKIWSKRNNQYIEQLDDLGKKDLYVFWSGKQNLRGIELM